MAAASPGGAAVIQENFSDDPAANGWKSYGATQLFQWDTVAEALRVTWDSSQTNSYFHHPLGTILARDDDFSFAFDLRLDDVATGVDPNKPSTFQLTVALLNLNDALRTNFFRGAGINAARGARNSVEFDYFPPSSDGITATISPVLISSNNQFAYDFTFPLELTVNDLFHVALSYTASNRVLATVITRNGQPFDPIKNVTLAASFTDFRLDTVAVCSFSDAGQSPPQFAGSILAHGTVDNIAVILPPPPVENLSGAFSNGTWRVQFASRSNWLYMLERTADFQSWTNVSPPTPGATGALALTDADPPAGKALYRVRAERP